MYNIIHVAEEIRCVRDKILISLERASIRVPGAHFNNIDESPPAGGNRSLFERAKRWTSRLEPITSELRG